MAAAHTITVNLWQLAGVVLLALSSVATILIPQMLNSKKGNRLTQLLEAKKAGDRLLLWGLVVGLLLGVLQVRRPPPSDGNSCFGWDTPLTPLFRDAR
jgi:MATE family multidrug resistance protein